MKNLIGISEFYIVIHRFKNHPLKDHVVKLKDLDEQQVAIYRQYATIEYEKRLAIAKFNLESAHSYARWLLASLLAMNGAALIGIASTGDMAGQLYIASGLFFTVGIASAFASGLFAWMNWDRAASLYRDMAEPKMLHGPDWDPKPLTDTIVFLDSTRSKAVVAGAISSAFLVLGLFSIWDCVALDRWTIRKLINFVATGANSLTEANMTYPTFLEVFAAWSAIGTFILAVFAYGKYAYERKNKRLRLERYLRVEKESGRDQGQRTLMHLLARVGMSEAEILDAAFRSKYIEIKTIPDEANRAVGVLLEYKP